MKKRIGSLIALLVFSLIFISITANACIFAFSYHTYVNSTTEKVSFDSYVHGIPPNGSNITINDVKYRFISNDTSDLVYIGDGDAPYHVSYIDELGNGVIDSYTIKNGDRYERVADYIIITGLEADNIYRLDMEVKSGLDAKHDMSVLACFSFDKQYFSIGDDNVFAIIAISLIVVFEIAIIAIWMKIRKKKKTKINELDSEDNLRDTEFNSPSSDEQKGEGA